MNKLINSEAVKTALANRGWSQKDLSEKVGVTPQSVTNWLKGVDFPRPDKLLKLAVTLGLNFEKIVVSKEAQPIVAFRKKGGSITTEDHLMNASSMGSLLDALTPFLPNSNQLRTQISSPSTEYNKLQSIVKSVRTKIGIGNQAILEYQHLINQFTENGAIIIPVMWGNKQNHGNALHILLPAKNVTFIYLNLDTHLEDFKFWMAHELAHVYTPELAGKDEGEDFADAFAGAILFPKEVSEKAYAECIKANSKSKELSILRKYAHEHKISIFSVYCETSNYAKAAELPSLKSKEKDIHALRSIARGSLVSHALFSPTSPDAATYIAASNSVFQSNFFSSLKRMLMELGTGSGFIQQLLDISIKDATALHNELVN